MFDLLINNGQCVLPGGSRKTNLGILDGKFAALDAPADAPAQSVLDATGKLVLPGLIDTHVHLPWPSASFDSVDNFATGSRGALHGGVTTLVEYVVPDDSGRILPAIERQLAKASAQALCDYSFHVILRRITPQTLLEMADAVSLGFSSFKIFTAYAGFRLEDSEVMACFRRGAELGALMCVHAEDGVLVSDSISQLVQAGKHQIEYYPLAHPRLADVEATFRMLIYARYTGARLHVVHVNTREGANFIQDARADGLPITGETCPQYLAFTSDVYKTRTPQAANFILAPVIREEEDKQALWDALASGGLDTVATDHCPYSTAQKTRGGDDFRTVPGGAGGIETLLPFLYTYGVRSGKLSLERMVEVSAANPARLFNMYPRKGAIAPGSDADVLIYDPEAGPSVIKAAGLHSAMDHTIYEGMEVTGRVDATILRGKVVVDHGNLTNSPAGTVIARQAYPG